STPVAGGPALPVDGPAVTLSRVREQQAEASQAQAKTAAGGVLQLNDWTYTQATGNSPFFFDPPGSFDFFNPLFAFNFGGVSPQQLFGLLFADIFGLPNAGSMVVPVFTGSTGTSGPMVFPPPGSTVTKTTFPNGSTVTTATFVTR